MKLPHVLRSTRFTLTFWYSLILLAAFGLFGTSVFLYIRHTEKAELEQHLIGEIDWISRLVEMDRMRFDFFAPFEPLSMNVERQIVSHYRSNPRNYVVLLTTLAGGILYESPGGITSLISAIALPPGETVVQSVHVADGRTLRVASRRTDPFVVQVAYSESEANAVVQRLLSIFFLLVPVVLCVAVGAGWIMAGMVLRPVAQITRLANHISAEHLNQRIPERDVPDEFGLLITTINKMFERLQRSFDEIREFSHSVAHELRTPLTILKGESELALTRDFTHEEIQRLASTYLEETARMSRIVDDLLTLARADGGQIPIQHEPVTIVPLLEEIADDAVMLAAEKPLEVILATNQPAIVTGDAHRLRQLFRILISNAVQYTDPGGRITLSSSVSEANVKISVSDTGIGIPAEHLPRIFDRFYRVESARTRAKGGSGLGLAIARWVVSAHQGTIRVQSSPGNGSTFTVELPLRPPSHS